MSFLRKTFDDQGTGADRRNDQHGSSRIAAVDVSGAILRKTRHVFFAACLLLTACALFQSWQTAYLKKAVNHTTKDEVIQRMGAPRESSKAATGGSLLLYRFKEFQAGDLNGPGRWWCDDYQLRFDQEDILRQWSKSDCSRLYNFGY